LGCSCDTLQLQHIATATHYVSGTKEDNTEQRYVCVCPCVLDQGLSKVLLNQAEDYELQADMSAARVAKLQLKDKKVPKVAKQEVRQKQHKRARTRDFVTHINMPVLSLLCIICMCVYLYVCVYIYIYTCKYLYAHDTCMCIRGIL